VRGGRLSKPGSSGWVASNAWGGRAQRPRPAKRAAPGSFAMMHIPASRSCHRQPTARCPARGATRLEGRGVRASPGPRGSSARRETGRFYVAGATATIGRCDHGNKERQSYLHRGSRASADGHGAAGGAGIGSDTADRPESATATQLGQRLAQGVHQAVLPALDGAPENVLDACESPRALRTTPVGRR
jgi:hypothetical protein